jgi:mono/diheme cytochrome c family protein
MRNNQLVLLCACALLIVVSGCGSSTPAATIPAATTIPTYSFIAPTEAPSVATAAATRVVQDTTELDPELVERGFGRYEALCASCHGADGAGIDEAPSLLNVTMTSDEFIDFMRSGGSIGTEHQFATDRLSASGARNLYQYLLSIRQSE